MEGGKTRTKEEKKKERVEGGKGEKLQHNQDCNQPPWQEWLQSRDTCTSLFGYQAIEAIGPKKYNFHLWRNKYNLPDDLAEEIWDWENEEEWEHRTCLNCIFLTFYLYLMLISTLKMDLVGVKGCHWIPFYIFQCIWPHWINLLSLFIILACLISLSRRGAEFGLWRHRLWSYIK